MCHKMAGFFLPGEELAYSEIPASVTSCYRAGQRELKLDALEPDGDCDDTGERALEARRLARC